MNRLQEIASRLWETLCTPFALLPNPFGCRLPRLKTPLGIISRTSVISSVNIITVCWRVVTHNNITVQQDKWIYCKNFNYVVYSFTCTLRICMSSPKACNKPVLSIYVCTSRLLLWLSYFQLPSVWTTEGIPLVCYISRSWLVAVYGISI